MKALITFLVFVGLTKILLAQSPQKMSYQAMIRNSSNQLITNSSVGMRFSILSGSENGTPVYIETQTPVSNANGLVTVEIGSGNIVFASIDIINWTAGPYFLKTETDPTGGTSYSITGTRQILGVPYALYATKAGNGFSGSYYDLTNKPVLFDGSWTSLTGKPNFATVATSGNYADLLNKPVLFSGNYNDLSNKPALAKVATSGSYIDLSNKPVTDGSETKVTAGTNIAVTGSGTSATPYIINLDIPHYVGELYAGGVVFYMDHTGKHGLICSMIDLGTEKWSYKSYDTIGATYFSPWDGQANTLKIIARQGQYNSAAKLCDNYTNADYGTGIYTDWFLPSVQQLCLLNDMIFEVNKTLENDGNSSTTPISNQSYWSSNQYEAITYGIITSYAYYFDFEIAAPYNADKYNALFSRPVRAF